MKSPAKAQRRKGKPNLTAAPLLCSFLCAFAPLREKSFPGVKPVSEINDEPNPACECRSFCFLQRAVKQQPDDQNQGKNRNDSASRQPKRRRRCITSRSKHRQRNTRRSVRNEPCNRADRQSRDERTLQC